MNRFFRNRQGIGALLVGGSALFLLACGTKQVAVEEENNQNMMTQQSENLMLIQTKEGNLSYRFEAPLFEEYEFAAEPYIEFRKGVSIITYNDSTQVVEATLTANYAIFMKRQELWEAKGNVRGKNAAGDQLETEQLFWNQKSKRIYSNVDSKITQKNGNVILTDGFESNEQFNDYTMRKVTGRMMVNTTRQQSDSTAPAQPVAADTVSSKSAEPNYPVIREGEAVARPKDPSASE